jgi:hypothetical protein
MVASEMASCQRHFHTGVRYRRWTLLVTLFVTLSLVGAAGVADTANAANNPYYSSCTNYKSTTLRQGSTGNCVKYLQWALNQLSYISPKLQVDGQFGPMTNSAVRTFQSRVGIGVDGVVGPQTWGKLDQLVPPNSSTPPPPPPPAPAEAGPGTCTSSSKPCQLRSSQSGKCLRPFTAEWGARLMQSTCTTSSNMRWIVSGDLIKHVQSGLCMDVKGAGTTDGTPMIIWGCNAASNNQRFVVAGNRVTNGFVGYTLRPRNVPYMTKCVDVEGASSADYAYVHLWQCHNGLNQDWQFRWAS